MLLGAFLVLLLALAWLARQVRDPWLPRLGERRRQSVRTVLVIPTVLLVVLSFAIVGLQLRWDASPSAVSWLIAATALTGSVLYGFGLLVWEGRHAFLARAVGWALLVAALAIPSTVTLALPLVAVLVPTLAVIHGEGPAGSRRAEMPNA